MPAPLNIPAIAPGLLMRFQKSDNNISGPKVAPNPAQAKDTIWKITLFSSNAITIPTAARTKRVIRDTIITCLSVASFLQIP